MPGITLGVSLLCRLSTVVCGIAPRPPLPCNVITAVSDQLYGNPGNHRNLTDGISERKIDMGPGYRVYYMQRGDRFLLLLAGGDKSTQQKDIARATALARGFQE